MEMVEEVKTMMEANGSELDQQRLRLKEREIELEYRMRLVEDRERQVRSEKQLLRVQQRHLFDGTMELECERQLVAAEKAKAHSQLNQEKIEDLSSPLDTNSVISPPPSVNG